MLAVRFVSIYASGSTHCPKNNLYLSFFKPEPVTDMKRMQQYMSGFCLQKSGTKTRQIRLHLLFFSVEIQIIFGTVRHDAEFWGVKEIKYAF